MPAITIAIRNGNTGAVTPAASAADVIAAINHGDDVLFNGQPAVLTNMGGNWLVQGQPVDTWFQSTLPATGPTVSDPSTAPQNFVTFDCAPGFIPAADGSMRCVDSSTLPAPVGSIPSPIIRSDPFPASVQASGNLNLTPGTLVILGLTAYFLFFRGRS